MLLFDVTVPATVPQRSEIPEGLMNYPVYLIYKDEMVFCLFLFVCTYVWNLYKFTFLNQSEPNFAHVAPLVWKRP
jgi:hypothetical protein